MNCEFDIVPMVSDADMDGKGYVHWKSWQEAYAGLIDREYLDGMSAERCIAMAHRWPENTLVAKDDSRVVGFACWGEGQGCDEGMGVVYAMYILAEYYGKGLGYRLMNATMEKLSNYEKVALWVLKGNERAIRFYERYGFRFDGAEAEIVLGSPRTELRMHYRRDK